MILFLRDLGVCSFGLVERTLGLELEEPVGLQGLEGVAS